MVAAWKRRWLRGLWLLIAGQGRTSRCRSRRSWGGAQSGGSRSRPQPSPCRPSRPLLIWPSQTPEGQREHAGEGFSPVTLTAGRAPLGVEGDGHPPGGLHSGRPLTRPLPPCVGHGPHPVAAGTRCHFTRTLHPVFPSHGQPSTTSPPGGSGLEFQKACWSGRPSS